MLEMLFGLLPRRHWWIDFTLAFLSAILLSTLAISVVWHKLLAA
jgi:hypothetical protein